MSNLLSPAEILFSLIVPTVINWWTASEFFCRALSPGNISKWMERAISLHRMHGQLLHFRMIAWLALCLVRGIKGCCVIASTLPDISVPMSDKLLHAKCQMLISMRCDRCFRKTKWAFQTNFIAYSEQYSVGRSHFYNVICLQSGH